MGFQGRLPVHLRVAFKGGPVPGFACSPWWPRARDVCLMSTPRGVCIVSDNHPCHVFQSRVPRSMKIISTCLAVFVLSLLGTNPVMASSTVSAVPPTSKADHQAIEALLASYARCVTEHDERGFRALLLDDEIPFAAVAASADSGTPPDLRQYEGFRSAVFASGQRYRQAFSNIRIEQHGSLAQVSLDFVTERLSGKRESSAGWKVLQLVRVGDHWKIASELYTF